MIEIKQQENQLSIYFNQQLIIKHTDQQPAFFVGQGNETIDHYRGNFEIHDDIESKIPLIDAKCTDDQIIFSYFLNELRVHFKEEEQRLIITIESSQPYNRLLNLMATSDLCVLALDLQQLYTISSIMKVEVS